MPSDFNTLLLPDLREMLAQHDDAGVGVFCSELYPGVVAEVLEGVDAAQSWEVLSHASPVKQAEIFACFPLDFQVELVKTIPHQALSRIIEEMPHDDRVDLISEMEPEVVEKLMPLIAHAERVDILKLMQYPESSAGSLVTTDYASLPADITVAEALERLRHQAPSRETIYYVYIVDEERHLLGFLSLRNLITARPSARLSDIMLREVDSLKVEDTREYAANEILRNGYIAMPVVDKDDKLIGIITYDDAAEVQNEEAEQDAYRQAAVAPLEDGYLDTPLLTLAWKRGIWLVILLGASSATAHVLNYFQPGDATAASAWMVLFLPLVLASGGNAGSQSATLVVRAISQNETVGQVRRIAWREVRIGIMLGLTLASIAFVMAWLLLPRTEYATTVSTTVFLVVAFGTFFGAMLPLTLNRVGVDPALMSNPLIASMSDMLGVVIYYNMAKWLTTVV
ncbi:MAG: magnesium transporter [Planctomycetaceae bacterium]